MAVLIDGKKVSEKIKLDLIKAVQRLKESGITPSLLTILVGNDPASQVYVRNNQKLAERLGVISMIETFPEEVSEEVLLEKIAGYNQNPLIDGIFLQMPLPNHLDEDKIIEQMDPSKDVDGIHPANMGHLLIGKPKLLPCTPLGVMKLLESYDISLEGKKAVVIGRSNVVGKPMAQLLLLEHATVTIAHSYTQNLKQLCQQADILVAAVGRGHFLTKEYVKPGAVVIDVGMNQDENGRLIGDVVFNEVSEIASYITPVPGGVGQMTVAMLMTQVIENAKKRRNECR